MTVYKYKLPIQNGKAYFTPPELIPDRYYLSAYYPTNTKYRGSYIEYKLYLNQRAAQGEMDTQITEYHNGEYLTPIAHFSANNQHITDTPVIFKIDGDTIGEYRTDENGIVTAPPQLLVLPEGEHKISATIQDGPGYIGTTLTQTFTTTKTKTQIIINDIEPTTRDNTLTITGRIETDQPFVAESTSIELNYNRNYTNGETEPITITQTIDITNNPEFTFQLAILPEEKPGYNYITIKAHKNEYQNSSETNKSFIIKAIPQIDVQEHIHISNRYYTFYGQINDEFGQPYLPPQSSITTHLGEGIEVTTIPIEIDGSFTYLQVPNLTYGVNQTRHWTLSENKYHTGAFTTTTIEYETSPQIIYTAPYTIDLQNDNYPLTICITDIFGTPLQDVSVQLTPNSKSGYRYTNEEGLCTFNNYARDFDSGQYTFTIRAQLGETTEESQFTTYVLDDSGITLDSCQTYIQNNKLILQVQLSGSNVYLEQIGEHYIQIDEDIIASNFIKVINKTNPFTEIDEGYTIRKEYLFELPINQYNEQETVTIHFEQFLSEYAAYDSFDLSQEVNIIQPTQINNSQLDTETITTATQLELFQDNQDHTITYHVKDIHDPTTTINHGYITLNTELIRHIGTQPTTLIIISSTNTASQGDTITLSILLKDADEIPIPNQEIKIYQGQILLGTQTTNQNGTTTRNVQINQNQPTITYTAEYTGSRTYEQNEATTLVTVSDYIEEEESTDPIYIDGTHSSFSKIAKYWEITRGTNGSAPETQNGILIIRGESTYIFKEPFTGDSWYDSTFTFDPTEYFELGVASSKTNATEKIRIKNDGTTTKYQYINNGYLIIDDTIQITSQINLNIAKEQDEIYVTITTTEDEYEYSQSIDSDKFYFYIIKEYTEEPGIILAGSDIFGRL